MNGMNTTPLRHILLHYPALLVFIVAVSSPIELCAQQRDTTATFRIETRDGNEYIGKILEQNNDQLRLRTEKLGVITIRMIEIVKIDFVNIAEIKDEKYWFENPQSTRHFWSPNGYGLKRGEGYYQNIWVLFNQVSVGITDHFSLGAGVVPLFLFAGTSTPAWLTPKFSIPVQENKFNIGVGGLFGTVLGEEKTGFGIAYGLFTLGNRNQNMTLGMGYGYAGTGWATHPAISLSALIRTGPRGYILTENYYLSNGTDGVLLLSFGGRRIIKKTGLDFGLILPAVTDGGFIAIPWLGITVPFGKTRRY
jgi:hypothetical protein